MYRLDEAVHVSFARAANDWDSVTYESEAFYMRVAAPGDLRCEGAQLGVLVTRGRRDRLDPSPWVDLSWYADTQPAVSLGGLEPFEYFLSVGRWLRRFPHEALTTTFLWSRTTTMKLSCARRRS